jgi:peptidoglycan/xylan/chitin deacetylase (PgdA/CDA1 family)
MIATSLVVLAIQWYSLESATAVGTPSGCVRDRTPFDPTHTGTKWNDLNDMRSKLDQNAHKNLIQNGDLGQGTIGAPRSWNPSHWGELKPRFIYPVPGYRGGKAAELVVTHWSSGEAEWRFRPILVSEHAVYAFSDEYNSNVVTNVTADYLLSSGTHDYEWLGDAEATGNAWKTFSAQITVPRGTVSLTVLHALDKNGSLRIGNACVTAMRAAPFPQGMVTLVFDDGRASQFKNARPILNAAGLKSTYAIITQPQRVRDPIGLKAFMTWAEITTLNREGNEIAAHSRTHHDLTTLSLPEAQTEVRGSYLDLVRRGFTPKIFVYPYGAVNSTAERLVRRAGFIGARGSYFGLDVASSDQFDLRVILIGKTTPAARIEEWARQAIADKSWLILELHDVVTGGGDEYASTPKKLRNIVNHIRQTGIKVVTLKEGIQLMEP